MPSGVPVATFAIGDAGAKNAAIFATSILAGYDAEIESVLAEYRQRQTDSVPNFPED